MSLWCWLLLYTIVVMIPGCLLARLEGHAQDCAMAGLQKQFSTRSTPDGRLQP